MKYRGSIRGPTHTWLQLSKRRASPPSLPPHACVAYVPKRSYYDPLGKVGRRGFERIHCKWLGQLGYFRHRWVEG